MEDNRAAQNEPRETEDGKPVEQERAEMREALSKHPETDVGPRKGSVGVHQDEFRSKE